MTTLKALSWNIESLSEKQLTIPLGASGASFTNFIASLVQNQGVDLLLVMEVSPNSAWALARGILESLNELQTTTNATRKVLQPPKAPQVWVAVVSDFTGKNFDLPASITPSRDFSRKVESDEYWKTLQKSYTASTIGNTKTPIWLLKDASDPSRTPEGDRFCIQSLLQTGLLRPDIEAYLAYFRCDGDDPDAPPASPYWNSDAGLGLNATLSGLVSQSSQNTELGYQNPLSSFNGRMPFRVQLFGNSIKQPNYIPLVLFHAPYSVPMPARVLANNQLVLTDAYGGSDGTKRVDLKDAPVSFICGDFNVDCKGNYPDAKLPLGPSNDNSYLTYGYFVGNGYTLTVQEKSSLVSLATGTEKNWPNSTDYRSSAYDNIVGKTSTPATFANHGIVDVINLLAADNSALGTTAKGVNRVCAAFQLYRKYISDHLPAVIQISF
jgi:hypothetical protein